MKEIKKKCKDNIKQPCDDCVEIIVFGKGCVIIVWLTLIIIGIISAIALYYIVISII